MLRLLGAIAYFVLNTGSVAAQVSNWDAPAVIADNKVLEAFQVYPSSDPRMRQNFVGVIADFYEVPEMLQEDDFIRFQNAMSTEDSHELIGGVHATVWDAIAYGTPVSVVFTDEHQKLERALEQPVDPGQEHEKDLFVDSIVRSDSVTFAEQTVGFVLVKSTRWPTTPGQVTIIYYSNPDGWADTNMTCLARQVLTVMYTDDDGSGYDVQRCIDEVAQQ